MTTWKARPRAPSGTWRASTSTRRAGIGGTRRELLRACEAWAKERGCTEFASDCELDNAASLAFTSTRVRGSEPPHPASRSGCNADELRQGTRRPPRCA
ncbi:GNAT family N-acetyltransferase [Enteroscipio rubneri]|uniref:GNAT family N-acetyltransferase n=1 Tax=Enteroscipio rubneri TaxID=2070686 RepID=UPI003D188316